MESDSDEELFPIENHKGINDVFTYEDPLLVTGLLRAVVEGNLEKVQDLVKSGKSVNINDNNGNTPLHIAVIKNNLQILKYLLLQDEIVVNTRNFVGETPLFQASKLGRYECVHLLIDAGANVNQSNNEEITPLHVSISCPNIAHLLILKGANLNVRDYSGDMPLHDAIAEGCLETVCMFLYYNGDANALGGNDLTPFMKAIIGEYIDIQDVLFEYVADFDLYSGDDISILELALRHNSPYVEKIIENVTSVPTNALFSCLEFSDTNIFKLIWDRLEFDESNPICIDSITDHINANDEHIDIICNSPNTNLLLKILHDDDDAFVLFLNDCIKKDRSLNLLAKMTFVLLEHSYILNTFDIHKIFHYYGYCELIYLLSFMEFKNRWLPNMLTCRLIFDIHHSPRQIQKQVQLDKIELLLEVYYERPAIKRNFLQFLEYCVDSQLIKNYSKCFPNEGIENVLPNVPKLSQLARDKSREYLIKKFNISTTCQYYTLLNSLDIAQVYKKILKFETKLYSVYK